MCYFTGFQIIGGEKMGRLDLGVFISSITPGGPADLDGCLKPGTLHFSISLVLYCSARICIDVKSGTWAKQK